jgi:hypothetical protein
MLIKSASTSALLPSFTTTKTFLERSLRRRRECRRRCCCRSLLERKKSTTASAEELPSIRVLSPPSSSSSKNFANNNAYSSLSLVSSPRAKTKSTQEQSQPSNVPIAIAIGFGFLSLSAVLYPAAKAMEKAMIATELAMHETTKLMEKDAPRAFNEGEQASLEWQELGKELRLLLKNIEQWGKPLVGDANSLESFDLNALGESMKDSLAEILEKSLIGIGSNGMDGSGGRPQLGGINLMQQSFDENLFKWQDAITDVIEDLTNLRLEAASKGQTANEETLKRALNQAKIASESFLISSGNSRTSGEDSSRGSSSVGGSRDDEEKDPANLIRKVSSSYDEQSDDFDIRTRVASEKLKAESRAKQESMDSF